jgi:Putative Ig domain
MNCMGRWLKFLFLSFAMVFSLCSAASGQTCASDSVDTSANNANVSLNDYAVIFADAATNCAAKADVALRTKLQNIIGLDLNNPNHHTDLQGRDGLLPFQGWLEGANVAMIFASATRLANAGISDATLDQYLLKVRDLFLATLDGQNKLTSKANGCGITTNARLTGDACMDDYTVAAAGFAWTAAYERWKLRPNAAAISGARALLQKAFSTDESICVVDPGIDVPSPDDPNGLPRVTPDGNGPCIPLPSSFTPEIIQRFNDKTYQVVSLNHGTRDSLAYGIGLMTSVSTAMVGLKIAGVSVDNTNVLERYFPHEQRLIARALWEGAQLRTALDGSVFLKKCWAFQNLSGNLYNLYDDTACDDRLISPTDPRQDDPNPNANSNPNVPGMYPVNQFYATFIFGDVVPQQSTGFDFSFVGEPAFDSLFNTTFYGPGRRTYYGQMGWDAGLAATLIPPSLTRRRAVSHSVPPALVSSPYSFSVLDPAADVEVPLSYQVNGTLPPGISFSGVTGMLSGTAPPSPGIFDFAINAVYVNGGTLPQEYALPVCQSTLASANVAVNIPVNSFFSTIPLNSNPLHLLIYDVVAGGLPPGALLDENTGVVSGAANLPDTYVARVRATLRPSGTVVLAACPAGTTTDLFYQISVGCGAGCQPQYEGYNDGLNTDNVWGWAWDKSFPTSPIQVDIYDSTFDVVPAGTPLLARVNANLFRQDLRDAGKGDGNHAFVFPVPDALKDGNAHRIHVTFAGTKTDLSWSPRILVPSSGRFVGAHSTNACDRIDGFALDNWQPNTPIDVNIFDNGVLLASLVANYDNTVVPATSGNGTHGFLYYTPDR